MKNVEIIAQQLTFQVYIRIKRIRISGYQNKLSEFMLWQKTSKTYAMHFPFTVFVVQHFPVEILTKNKLALSSVSWVFILEITSHWQFMKQQPHILINAKLKW